MLVIVGVHGGLGRTVGYFPPLELAWYPYPLPQSRLASLPLPQSTSRLQTGPFLPVFQTTCPSHTTSRHSIQPDLTPIPTLGQGTQLHTNPPDFIPPKLFPASRSNLLIHSLLCPNYSVCIKPRTNKRSPHTQVSSQKYKQYETSSQYFTSKIH